jgi:hypothetical protein
LGGLVGMTCRFSLRGSTTRSSGFIGKFRGSESQLAR